MKKPIVWTIAGSDSSGGAGIQADLHTFEAFHVHACSVITAITAQNNKSIRKIMYLSPALITAQIDVLLQDLPAKAIKIGMLGNEKNVQCIYQLLQNMHCPIVYDPVLHATSGSPLLKKSAYRVLLKDFIARVSLFTPNIPEAEILLQRKITTSLHIEETANEFIHLGVKAVLIKGGHTQDGNNAQDFFTDGQESFWLSLPRISKINARGSGCVFASAIVASLAQDHTLQDALVIAKSYVHTGIKRAKKLARETTPVQHKTFSCYSMKMPRIFAQPPIYLPFPSCEKPGFYPIVDNLYSLEKLLASGVTTIQFRLKNRQENLLRYELSQAIAIAKLSQCQLFINDHWQLAIELDAYGVHLGYEDLRLVDLATLYHSGLRLGISTHNYFELAYALTLNPSYIAFGPIFPTTTKKFSIAPQGIKKLKIWRRLVSCHLIAIGGIKFSYLALLKKINVDGVAVISALHTADLADAAKIWLATWSSYE